MFVAVSLVSWVLAIIVGVHIGKNKKRSGLAWSFWLGWIGVVVLALSADKDENETQLKNLSEKQRELADLRATLEIQEIQAKLAITSGTSVAPVAVAPVVTSGEHTEWPARLAAGN